MVNITVNIMVNIMVNILVNMLNISWHSLDGAQSFPFFAGELCPESPVRNRPKSQGNLDVLKMYPLVNIQKTMERSTIF